MNNRGILGSFKPKLKWFEDNLLLKEKKEKGQTYMRPRIVAFIPAHNEEKSIRDYLAGLGDQLLPRGIELDVIVIADNCTNRTEEVTLAAGQEFNIRLTVLTTKNNKQRKIGALNAAWKRVYGDPLDLYDQRLTQFQEYYKQSVKVIFGMNADSRLAPRASAYLWEGLMSARNIGRVMATYTMRMPKMVIELFLNRLIMIKRVFGRQKINKNLISMATQISIGWITLADKVVPPLNQRRVPYN